MSHNTIMELYTDQVKLYQKINSTAGYFYLKQGRIYMGVDKDLSLHNTHSYIYMYTNNTTTPAGIYTNTNNYVYFRPRAGTWYIIGEQQSMRRAGSRFHTGGSANSWHYTAADYYIEGLYQHSTYYGVTGSTRFIEVALQYRRSNTWYTM